MKKLLVFMLVLGLASVASAAVVANLELSIDGVRDGMYNTTEVYILPCDTLLIDVYNNSAGPISDQFWLGLQINNTNPYAPDTDEGEWYRETMTTPNPAAGNAASAGNGGYGNQWWSFDTGLYGMEPGQYPVAGTWFTCVFHCLSDSDVYINLYDTSGSILEDSILVHQHAIPEPATIALLSLGGLLLRKKR
jgi:hypothetical protein